MDDIAREIGMSKKTIYQQYADKDKLVHAYLDKEKQEQISMMEEISKNSKNANGAEGFSKPKFKNFEKIALDEENQVCIIAKKNIKVGEEIFCGYGKNI